MTLKKSALLRRKKRGPLIAQPTHLYFFFNPRANLIKIGVSNAVEFRRKKLSHHCGCELEILGVLLGGAKYERDLHSMFLDQQTVGEWFEAIPALRKLAMNPLRVPKFKRDWISIAEKCA